MQQIEEMRNILHLRNPTASADDAQTSAAKTSHAPLTPAEMSAELQEREKLLQQRSANAKQTDRPTDQWRVYEECVEQLKTTEPLRLFLQASAGTGKSFLLESLYLWCLVNGAEAQACAPTGIAAARIFVPRTPIKATTVHNLFQLNFELASKIDPANDEREDVRKLLGMTVLFIDEGSMLDDDCWRAICDQCSAVGHRDLADAGLHNTKHPQRDVFGRVHIIVCVDLKQLPPATSRPPFLAMDMRVAEQFRFRVLRENRRIVQSDDAETQAASDELHAVLEDVAHGRLNDLVRKNLIAAYVRGAQKTAGNVPVVNGTACFSKRKYRDRWNKIIQLRVAKKFGRSLRIDAEFCPANNPEQVLRTTKSISRAVRNQAPLKLHLAGQWLGDPLAFKQSKPYYMRAMLVANVDVPNRFANGTQGRIVSWSPEQNDRHASPIGASDPAIMVRFVHEHALTSDKQTWLSGIDFIDIASRSEEAPRAKGKPRMVQLQIQPANGLTIHKVQALTIKDFVYGCLEGTV